MKERVTKMEEKRIIEIKGVKLEVDLSQATKIESYKIGDNVKVLRKSYGDSYSVLNGVIIAFVNFETLPTIQIAVFKQDYSTSTIEFVDFNAKSEGMEISLCSPHELRLEKNSVVERMNCEIQKKSDEVKDLKAKRDWFLEYFAKYFKDA